MANLLATLQPTARLDPVGNFIAGRQEGRATQNQNYLEDDRAMSLQEREAAIPTEEEKAAKLKAMQFQSERDVFEYFEDNAPYMTFDNYPEAVKHFQELGLTNPALFPELKTQEDFDKWMTTAKAQNKKNLERTSNQAMKDLKDNAGLLRFDNWENQRAVAIADGVPESMLPKEFKSEKAFNKWKDSSLMGNVQAKLDLERKKVEMAKKKMENTISGKVKKMSKDEAAKEYIRVQELIRKADNGEQIDAMALLLFEDDPEKLEMLKENPGSEESIKVYRKYLKQLEEEHDLGLEAQPPIESPVLGRTNALQPQAQPAQAQPALPDWRDL